MEPGQIRYQRKILRQGKEGPVLSPGPSKVFGASHFCFDNSLSDDLIRPGLRVIDVDHG